MANYIQDWEQTRKKGRIKYSLVQGLIFALVFTLLKERKIIWECLTGINTDIISVFTEFIWILMGSILGYYIIVWWFRERLYRNEKRNV